MCPICGLLEAAGGKATCDKVSVLGARFLSTQGEAFRVISLHGDCKLENNGTDNRADLIMEPLLGAHFALPVHSRTLRIVFVRVKLNSILSIK